MWPDVSHVLQNPFLAFLSPLFLRPLFRIPSGCFLGHLERGAVLNPEGYSSPTPSPLSSPPAETDEDRSLVVNEDNVGDNSSDGGDDDDVCRPEIAVSPSPSAEGEHSEGHASPVSRIASIEGDDGSDADGNQSSSPLTKRRRIDASLVPPVVSAEGSDDEQNRDNVENDGDDERVVFAESMVTIGDSVSPNVVVAIASTSSAELSVQDAGGDPRSSVSTARVTSVSVYDDVSDGELPDNAPSSLFYSCFFCVRPSYLVHLCFS
jgi:hypothetical protein